MPNPTAQASSIASFGHAMLAALLMPCFAPARAAVDGQPSSARNKLPTLAAHLSNQR